MITTRQALDYILAKSEEEKRNYLDPGENAPAGKPVEIGERGGHYWVPDGNAGPAKEGPTSLDPSQFVRTAYMTDLGLEGGVNESASSVVWVEEGTLPPTVGLSDTRLLLKYNFEEDPNKSPNDYYYDYPVKVMAEIARYKIDKVLGHGLVPEVLPVGEGFAMRWVDDSGFGGTGVKHAPGGIYDIDEVTLLTPNQLQNFADMSIIDCLMGNADRHSGNWIIDNDNDKVWAIDNEAGDMAIETIYPLKMIAGNLPDIAQYDIEAFRDSLLESVQNVREHVVDIGNIVLETLGSLPSDIDYQSDDWAYDTIASRLDEIEATLVNEWPRLKSYWLPEPRSRSKLTNMLDKAIELAIGARKYLKPGQHPPAGVPVQTGRRGGRYYKPNTRKRARPVIGILPADSVVKTSGLDELGLAGGINRKSMHIVTLVSGTFPARPGLSDTRAVTKRVHRNNCNAEIARYEIDQALQQNIVPPIMTGSAWQQTGIADSWGVTWGLVVSQWVDDSGFGGKAGHITEESPPLSPNQLQDMCRITIMDCLLGNGDRHPGNFVVDPENDKVWAIDNEFSKGGQNNIIGPITGLGWRIPGFDQYDLNDVERRLDYAFSEIKDRAPEISGILSDRIDPSSARLFERAIGILERDFSDGINQLHDWVTELAKR